MYCLFYMVHLYKKVWKTVTSFHPLFHVTRSCISQQYKPRRCGWNFIIQWQSSVFRRAIVMSLPEPPENLTKINSAWYDCKLCHLNILIFKVSYTGTRCFSSIEILHRAVKKTEIKIDVYLWNRSWLLILGTRHFDTLHVFSATFPRCFKYVYLNSFFPRTARLGNSFPAKWFPLTYNLSGFKSRVNRQILSPGSLYIAFLFAFILLLFLFLVT